MSLNLPPTATDAQPPFLDEVEDTPSSNVYRDDSLLLNICTHLEKKKDVLNVMRASKQAFVVGAGVLYEEVDTGMVGRSAGLGVNHNRLMMYLPAIRSIEIPPTQPNWPNQVAIESLTQQYPNLQRIRFNLPDCKTPSSIILFQSEEFLQVAGKPTSTRIYGLLHLALDGEHGSQQNLFAEKMGLVSPWQKFYLAGVRAGNQYKGGLTGMPTLSWSYPLGFLIPGNSWKLRFQDVQETQWPTLLSHLEELTITNRCTGRQMEQIATSLPKLKHLTVYQFFRSHSTGEYPVEEQRMVSPDRVLRRIVRELKGRVHFLESATFGADESFHPELSDTAECPGARYLAVRWDVDSVYAAYQAQSDTIEAWRKQLLPASLHPDCTCLDLLLPFSVTERNPLVAGLALSKIVPALVKIRFFTSPEHNTKPEFLRWVAHVKEARLYGMELDLHAKQPGFR